jgi:hypothetical protein
MDAYERDLTLARMLDKVRRRCLPFVLGAIVICKVQRCYFQAR